MKIKLPQINLILLCGSIFLIAFGSSVNIIMAFFAIQGLVLLCKKKTELFNTPVQKYFLAFFLCYWIPVGISIIGAANIERPLTRVFIGHLPYYFTGLFLIEFLKEKARRDIALKSFFVSLLVWGIDAYIQQIFGRDLLGYKYDPELMRLGGPFKHAYSFGYYMAILSPFALFYAVIKKWSATKGTLLFLFVTPLVILGNTRTGWMVYTVVSTLFLSAFYLRKAKRKILWILAAMAVFSGITFGVYKTLPVVTQRVDKTLSGFSGGLDALNQATSGRVCYWICLWNCYKDNPVNGVGARCFRYVAEKYWPENNYGYNYGGKVYFHHPHNFVMERAVGTGTIGLLGLLGEYVIAILIWLKADKKTRRYALPVAVSLIAFNFPLDLGAALYATKHSAIWWLITGFYFANLTSGIDCKEPKEYAENSI